MKILLTGSSGQLATELIKSSPSKLNNSKIDLIPVDKNEFDLTKVDLCKSTLEKIEPNWIINTAAYTAVDHAEKESESPETNRGE